MNFKTTIVLAALLLVGVFALWMFGPEKKDGTDVNKGGTNATNTVKYVFEPLPDEKNIVRLHWERPGKPRIVFERNPKTDAPQGPEEWRILEPIQADAEGELVKSFIEKFARLPSRARFEPGTAGAPNAADVGLDPAQATVTLVARDGKEHKIEVGRTASMSNDTYVRSDGEKTIHAAGRDLLREVRRDLKEFRAQTLLKFDISDVTAVRVEHDDRGYDLQRDAATGEWLIQEPLKAFGDKEKIRLWLAKIAMLSAADFVEDAPKSLNAYELDKPFLKITLQTESKSPPAKPAGAPGSRPAESQPAPVRATHTLLVGGFADMKNEKRYVKLGDQPWVASVPKAVTDALPPKLGELRDARVTRLKAADATQLEIVAGGLTAVLKNVEGQWRGTDDLAELDVAAVIDVLRAFEDLKADEYIDRPEELSKYDHGLDNPRAILRVTGRAPGPPVGLKIGKDTASGHSTYVQLEGQPTVFVTSKADRLAITPLALRDKAIFKLGGDEHVQWLDLTRGPIRYALLKEKDQWKMLEPADAPVDLNGVGGLVLDLGRLYAKRVVAKGGDAAYGLEEPALTINFVAEKAAPPATQASQPASAPADAKREIRHKLVVGRKNNVAYCRKDNDPFIFELDESVYQVFSGELIRRDLFDFKAEDVTAVTIQAPNNTALSLQKQDKDWKYGPDPFLKLSQKKIHDWLKELSQTRVETFLMYRDADLEAAGLADAPVTLTLTLKDDRQITVKIGQEAPGALPRKGALVEAKRAFLLRRADVEKFLRAVDYFVQENKPPGQPGFPGQPPEEEPEFEPPIGNPDGGG